MKMISLLLVSVIVLAQSPQDLVIIGDSLTEGYGVAQEKSYPSLLEKKISEGEKTWKVTNHGISGSTTASALSRVNWILKNPPDVVILALGANDGLRGVKPEATEENLDKAIKALKSKEVKVILAGMKMPPNYRGGNFSKDFEGVYRRLAKKHNIPFIPFMLPSTNSIPINASKFLPSAVVMLKLSYVLNPSRG